MKHVLRVTAVIVGCLLISFPITSCVGEDIYPNSGLQQPSEGNGGNAAETPKAPIESGDSEGAGGSESVEGTGGSEGSESVEGTGGSEGSESVEGTEGAEGSESVEGTEGAEGSNDTEGAGSSETPIVSDPGDPYENDKHWGLP